MAQNYPQIHGYKNSGNPIFFICKGLSKRPSFKTWSNSLLQFRMNKK